MRITFSILSIGLSFLVLFPSLSFAADKVSVRTQGVLMELNIKQMTAIVNEKLFLWNRKTMFFNEKASPIAVENFKPKSWVYVEGFREKGGITAEKIYLLPGFVDGKKKSLYPFME
jgi:hypothetical protein